MSNRIHIGIKQLAEELLDEFYFCITDDDVFVNDDDAFFDYVDNFCADELKDNEDFTRESLNSLYMNIDLWILKLTKDRINNCEVNIIENYIDNPNEVLKETMEFETEVEDYGRDREESEYNIGREDSDNNNI